MGKSKKLIWPINPTMDWHIQVHGWDFELDFHILFTVPGQFLWLQLTLSCWEMMSSSVPVPGRLKTVYEAIGANWHSHELQRLEVWAEFKTVMDGHRNSMQLSLVYTVRC